MERTKQRVFDFEHRNLGNGQVKLNFFIFFFHPKINVSDSSKIERTKQRVFDFGQLEVPCLGYWVGKIIYLFFLIFFPP